MILITQGGIISAAKTNKLDFDLTIMGRETTLVRLIVSMGNFADTNYWSNLGIFKISHPAFTHSIIIGPEHFEALLSMLAASIDYDNLIEGLGTNYGDRERQMGIVFNLYGELIKDNDHQGGDDNG